MVKKDLCSEMFSASRPMGQAGSLRYRSRLAAFGLQVHDRMAGKFLPFAGVGEKAVNAVTARGGERIFGTPHFLQHQVAVGRLVAKQLLHTLRRFGGSTSG